MLAYKKLLVLVAIVAALFVSCKDDDKKNNNNNNTNNEQVVYPLPSPFEVSQLLQKAVVPFNPALMSSVASSDSFLRQSDQAINLGIYGADLAYASTYNQSQMLNDLLNATKKLSDELGITNIIDASMMERIEVNIQNEDSLYKIINNIYYKTYDNLIKQEKGAIAVLVLAGAWVEVNYIATQLAITSQDSKSLMNKIAEQKYNVNILFNLFNEYKDDADVAQVITEMTSIKNVFDKLQADSLGNISIDQKTFDELTKLFETQRNSFISTK